MTFAAIIGAVGALVLAAMLAAHPRALSLREVWAITWRVTLGYAAGAALVAAALYAADLPLA